MASEQLRTFQRTGHVYQLILPHQVHQVHWDIQLSIAAATH